MENKNDSLYLLVFLELRRCGVVNTAAVSTEVQGLR